MLLNIKVTGGLNIESGHIDPKATGGWNIESGQIDPKATQGLNDESTCVTWRIQIFNASGFQGRAERQRNPSMKEITRWHERHNCMMGKDLRCVILEKASSLLLPWEWSLLGNCVAMALCPPDADLTTPTNKLTSCEKQGVFTAVRERERERGGGAHFCFFFFFPQATNFSVHGLLPHPPLLSTPLTHDPSPFQTGASSPGAGTNMGCVATVHRATSFSHSSFLVSALFSLAVELDTLWQRALRQLTRDKTLQRLHLTNPGNVYPLGVHRRRETQNDWLF